MQTDLDEINTKVRKRHAKAIKALEAERKKALAALAAFEKKAAPVLRKIERDLEAEAPDVDTYDWPEPAEGDEDPDPLFNSTREYVEQIDRYKLHQGKPISVPKKSYSRSPATCSICGKPFEATSRNKTLTCSPSCLEKWRWRMAKPASIPCRFAANPSNQSAARRSAQRRTAATRRDESLCLSKAPRSIMTNIIKPEKYQLLPELMREQYEALKKDIAELGVIVPVIVDEFGAILDGHNRARACRELGINDYPVEVRSGLSEAEKRVLARKLNVLRRHMNREQVSSLISDQLRETPDWSNRRIGRELGVDHKTVGSVRADLIANRGIPRLEKTVGDDGKARKTKRPRRKARPAIEDWDDDDDDDDDDDEDALVEDFDDASRPEGDDKPESDRARLRRERREDRELAAWGGSRAKTAKFEHAIGLIKHGVDPNSEEVQKLFLEAAGTVIKSGGGYRVFAHCTEAGERDWHLFILFLSKEWNWFPEHAARHVEYLSQKQFMNPDEWLGEEGRRFRKQPGSGNEPSDEFKQAWAAFKEPNSGRSQAEIIAETEAILKERGPAPPPPPRKRRKPAPERAA